MKNLIFIIILLLIMVSCAPTEQYRGEEVAAFVANDEAAFTEDSIAVYNPVIDEMVYRRFALLNGAVYYPEYDTEGVLFYTIAVR